MDVFPPEPRRPPQQPNSVIAGGGITAPVVVSTAIYLPILKKNCRAATPGPPAVQIPPDRSPQTASPSAPAVPIDVEKKLTQAESDAPGNGQTSAREALGRVPALDLVKEWVRGPSYQRKVDDRLAGCP